MGFRDFAIYYTLFSQWMQVSANLCFLNEAPKFIATPEKGEVSALCMKKINRGKYN